MMELTIVVIMVIVQIVTQEVMVQDVVHLVKKQVMVI